MHANSETVRYVASGIPFTATEFLQTWTAGMLLDHVRTGGEFAGIAAEILQARTYYRVTLRRDRSSADSGEHAGFDKLDDARWFADLSADLYRRNGRPDSDVLYVDVYRHSPAEGERRLTGTVSARL